MKILGIETSCDETSASVVDNGHIVLSNQTLTSLKEHAKYGGIIPEIASRRQIELIYAIVESALKKANVTLEEIDAIAVTKSPGLLGSLLVGICFARGLAKVTGKPLIEVDHIQGHIYANFLKFVDEQKEMPKLPAIGLVVSGGHSSLYKLKDFKAFQLLAQTRDDAAGEAFDKVARLLDLGYPGGPIIDRMAKEGINDGIKFPQARIEGSLDFSFSGLKTAVLYYVQKHAHDKNFSKSKVAYAFQKSVVETLTDKSLRACALYKIKTLLIGGGVAANSMLRDTLKSKASQQGVDVYFPPMALCLDNAAMIAGLGHALLPSRKLTRYRNFAIN